MKSQAKLADLGLSPLLQGDQRPVFSFTWHINWCQSSLTHFSQNGSQAFSLSKQPFKTCFARRAALSLQPLMDPCARASVQLGAPRWLQPRRPFPNFWTSATSLRSLMPSCHPAPQQLGMWRGPLTPLLLCSPAAPVAQHLPTKPQQLHGGHHLLQLWHIKHHKLGKVHIHRHIYLLTPPEMTYFLVMP